MRIIVDGDGCPGKSIIETLGKEQELEVIIYCDINHILSSDYSQIKYMDSGFQSVDMAVANEAKENDIVVTQDYGVAAMALGKRSYAISPKGYIYDNENMDRLLLKDIFLKRLEKVEEKPQMLKKELKEMMIDYIKIY